MAIVKKSANIEVTAKTEGAVRGLNNVAKATGRAKNAAEASGKAMERTGKQTDFLEKSVGRLSAVMKGFIGLQAVQKLAQIAEQGFKVRQVMDNLPISIDKARESTQGLSSDFELGTAAAKAVRLGVVQTEEEFANLAKAATKLGLSVGQDAGKSVEDLTTALGRASPLILDNLGITLKLEQAHELYAEKLGKTVDKLTEVEKEEAFRVIGLEKAVEAAEKVTIKVDGMTGAWARLKTQLSNFMDLEVPKFLDGIGFALENLDATVVGFMKGGGVFGAKHELDKRKAEEAAFPRTAKRGAPEFFGEQITRELETLDDADAAASRKAAAEAAKKRKRGGGRRREVDIASGFDGASPRDISDESSQGNVVSLIEERSARKIDAIDRELEAERRRIEVQEALHGQSMELIRQREEAELSAIERKREWTIETEDRAALEADAEQVRHDATLARIAQRQEMEEQAHQRTLQRQIEEQKARDATRAVVDKVTSAVASSTQFAANIAVLAATATEGSEERKKRAAARAAGVMSAVMAAVEVARSIASFATYDFVGGAAHAAAAVAFTTASVVAFKEAGGGSMPAPSLGAANSAPSAAGGSGGSSGPRAPVVPTSIPPQGQQGQAAGGQFGRGQSTGKTTIINIAEMRTMTASDREEEGKRLGELIRSADRSLGVA